MKINVCSTLTFLLIFFAAAFAQDALLSAGDLNRLGVTEIQGGNFARGIQLLEEAAKRDATNGKIYYNLGTAYFHLGKLEKARSALTRSAELRPRSAAVLNQLGVVEMEQGDNAAALQSLRWAVDEQPDNMTALYNLGCLYIRIKEFDLAVDVLERAKSRDSRNPEIRINLAFAYGRLSQVSKAIDETQATLELSPDDKDARQMLVILYLLDNERTEALKELKRLERSGVGIEPWLSTLALGKRIVSVADLGRK
jgi:Flp pilus assembly protein TadD